MLLIDSIDNHIDTYVGWNIRHFKRKAKMSFYTPANYLEAHDKM